MFFRRSGFVGFVVFFILFLLPAFVSAAERPPLPVREEEKLCWNIIGTQDERACLEKTLFSVGSSVDRWVDLFKEKYKADGDIVTLLDEAQQAWDSDVNYACETLMMKRYSQGSIRLAAPYRCMLNMTNERGHLLSMLAGMTFSPSRSFLEEPRDEQRICWNPFGLAEELRCLEKALVDIKVDLNNTVARIKKTGSFTLEDEYMVVFDEAHKKWLQNMNSMCDSLLKKLFESSPLAQAAPIWFKYMMIKEREHFLLVLYHRTLYP